MGGWKAKEDIQYYHAANERPFCLLTVSDEVFVVCDGAGFGYVPWDAWLWSLWIAHIGTGLVGYGNGVESDDGGVGEDGEKRWEDMEDVHGGFGEHEEHGEDRDDKIEVCDTVER